MKEGSKYINKILLRIKSTSITDVINLYYRHLKHAEGYNDLTEISFAPDEHGNMYPTFYVDSDARRYKNI